MNGPLLAAIIVAAAVAFTLWYAWWGIYEPSGWIAALLLLVWFLPLFFAGGLAAGYNIAETTNALLLTIFFGFLGWLRNDGIDWFIEAGRRRSDEPRSSNDRSD